MAAAASSSVGMAGQPLRVGIIGGGIGGLALAHLLAAGAGSHHLQVTCDHAAMDELTLPDAA